MISFISTAKRTGTYLMPYRKIKMDQRPNVSAKIVKLLEKKQASIFMTWIRHGVLNHDTKSTKMKKTDKLDFTKI